MIGFGKYENKLTWEEVLDKDPRYCEWVLNQGSAQPRFREFQHWLQVDEEHDEELPGYKGLFTRDGDLISDLRAHVRSGEPCFSQLQNLVKNPFEYSKTRLGKEPKFLYHWTDDESLEQILKSGQILPSLEQDGDAHMGDGVYLTTIPEWASKEFILRNNYGPRAALMKDEYSRRAEAFIRIPFEELKDFLGWAGGEFQTEERSVFAVGGGRPLRLRWRTSIKEYAHAFSTHVST